MRLFDSRPEQESKAIVDADLLKLNSWRLKKVWEFVFFPAAASTQHSLNTSCLVDGGGGMMAWGMSFQLTLSHQTSIMCTQLQPQLSCDGPFMRICQNVSHATVTRYNKDRICKEMFPRPCESLTSCTWKLDSTVLVNTAIHGTYLCYKYVMNHYVSQHPIYCISFRHYSSLSVISSC